jgi:hypothetical protein
MATFLSNQLTPPVTPTPGVGLGGRTLHWARAEITTTAALTTADSLELFDVPARARLMAGGFIKTADLDTGTTLTLNIGTAATPTLLASASNVGQAGGVALFTLATGIDVLLTTRTRFRIVPQANATGWTNGLISVMLPYIIEEPA